MEIARKLAREMDQHKVVSVSRTYVPNEYAVWLSPRDREQFEGYENSLHFSPRFSRFAEALAHELATRHRIDGGTVAEIGCGKADFLKLLCRIGRCRGLGFDPSYEERSDDPPVSVLRETYGDKKLPAADLLVCRHCLEHVEAPLDLLTHVAEVHGASGPRPVTWSATNRTPGSARSARPRPTSMMSSVSGDSAWS